MPRLALVAAADRQYRVQLEVMLTSVRAHLQSTWHLDVLVMSNDLNAADVAWSGRTSLDTVRCVIPAIPPECVLPLRHGDHVSLATYFRLLAIEHVAQEADRAIYLDCDLVVMHPLNELLCEPLCGKTIGAVRALSIPSLESAGSCFSDVPDAAHRPYFNAGVMLIDVPRWRSTGVSGRALAFLREKADSVRYWDQDALNYALLDDWQELDPRWNRTSDYHTIRSGDRPAPFPPATFARLTHPFVAHFVSGYKPWDYYGHPDRRLYDRYLRLTGHWHTRMTPLKAFQRRLRDVFMH